MLHYKHAGIGKIVDEQKLTVRRSRPPYRDGGTPLNFRLMKSPDQCGRHMAIVGMKIVTWPVKIGRLHRNEIATKLSPVSGT